LSVKEQLEKIDFQEEIRKVKTMRLADRVEYIHPRFGKLVELFTWVGEALASQ